MRRTPLFTFLFILSSCASSQIIAQPASKTAEDKAISDQIISGNSSIQEPSKLSSEAASTLSASPIQSASHSVKNFETDLADWEAIADEDGVKTYRQKSAENGIVAFRGEKVVHATMKKIASVLSDQEMRKDWVDSLAETKLIRQPGPLERIEYNRVSAPWPLQDRDFVYRAKVETKRKEKSILISMASVEDASEPPRSGVVRANILHSYYYLRDVTEKDGEPLTLVILEIAADPKGIIPNWVANLTQKRWPHHTLTALEKCTKRADLKTPPEVERYFN